MARTWEYLHGASGAAITAHRDASAHALSPAALSALRVWLSQRIA